MITKLNFESNCPMSNVREDFIGLTAEEAAKRIERHRTSAVNICLNYTNDFNKASVIRASNSFLAKELYLIGKRRIDRRGSVGLHHLENIFHSESIEPVLARLMDSGYTVFPIVRNSFHESESLFRVSLPVMSAFIYGEQELPISNDVINLCNGSPIRIGNLGSAFDVSTGQAAGIMMSEYSRRNR